MSGRGEEADRDPALEALLAEQLADCRFEASWRLVEACLEPARTGSPRAASADMGLRASVGSTDDLFLYGAGGRP